MSLHSRGSAMPVEFSLQRCSLLGATVALATFALTRGLFVALPDRSQLEYAIGGGI